MTHEELKAKGFVLQADGSYRKLRDERALADPKPEHREVPALARRPPKRKGRAEGIRLRVLIISIRQRLLDDDNLCAGAKPLRDAIAARLGVDDADKRIKWEYQQLEWTGQPATLIRFEWVVSQLA